MPTTDSPLRYPGGKTQLAPFVAQLLQANDLLDGLYIEPFAGGCGIAWKLLMDGLVTEVYINDVDPAIYAFWASVLRHNDELCARIEGTAVTIEEWHKQRAVYDSARPRLTDLGFATFFLNRTNRSGILKAGVIGGLQQDSDYLLDCRFNKVDLLRKIRRIGLYRDRVKLSSLDAEAFLRQRLPKLPRRSLVNIDPPYFRRGPELYCSFYQEADHASLAKAVKGIKQSWLLTYDDVPEIRALYAGLPQTTNRLNYSVQLKRVGVELLVMDARLRMPRALVAA